ncbi:GNAT family N-acetyltransferase [Roseateles aquatilis]|uniref:GNAT family N-acetyltransferase n=1 Tax=Roseateles aquatilis TaxID=431061 RepID=A0A246JMS8_9BURK|nr:N-acetyltransferase [Roseateles aquatilis]OWQ93936.1 GNAT family N-acetyltransferase [Roseateles aquatilis]
MTLTLRSETPADIDAIARLTAAAFLHAPHSSHTEHFIVDALRRHGQLTVSLIAEKDDAIVGHVALSPVEISSGATEWFGLGPISVLPECQAQGIGTLLMRAALSEIQRQGAQGCVLLGDPAYYGRFGFKPEPSLVLPGVPPEYFQALSFGGEMASGNVSYHDAFNATSAG